MSRQKFTKGNFKIHGKTLRAKGVRRDTMSTSKSDQVTQNKWTNNKGEHYLQKNPVNFTFLGSVLYK